MADLNALYSYQGQEPRPLPHEISYTESWGGTNFRQGVESFTEEEIQRAGYTGPYTRPEYNQEYQRRHWNSETLSYVIEDKTDEEIWEPIRRERNRLLAESDWTMTADAPENTNFREWEMHRQRLRDLPSFYEDPKDVMFPRSPEGRADDDFDQPRIHEDRLLWRIRDLEGIVKDLQNMVKTLNYRVFKPFPSWNWNEVAEKWEAPIARPVDYDEEKYYYRWDEDNKKWELITRDEINLPKNILSGS